MDGFVDRLKIQELLRNEFPAKRKHAESPTSREPRKKSIQSTSSASASSASHQHRASHPHHICVYRK